MNAIRSPCVAIVVLDEVGSFLTCVADDRDGFAGFEIEVTFEFDISFQVVEHDPIFQIYRATAVVFQAESFVGMLTVG